MPGNPSLCRKWNRHKNHNFTAYKGLDEQIRKQIREAKNK